MNHIELTEKTSGKNLEEIGFILNVSLELKPNRLLLYCHVVDEKPNTTAMYKIHIGSNDITKLNNHRNDITKLNYHSINADDLTKKIANIGLKCKYYDVGHLVILSVLARINSDLKNVIKQTFM